MEPQAYVWLRATFYSSLISRLSRVPAAHSVLSSRCAFRPRAKSTSKQETWESTGSVVPLRVFLDPSHGLDDAAGREPGREKRAADKGSGSVVSDSATPRTAAHQAPLSMGFSRTRHFKESIKFIHECRLQGEGCLVHCLAGVSRSVTLVVAYIMTVTDFGWEDALHTVRAGRSCANPNLGFQRQLQEFEELQVHQFRQWLREEYGESPLRDAEEARSILAAPGILKLWPFLRRP
uniref:Dual specificity phosphatase 22 n=1 Tax=Bos taurus TaxID=9913 RepID=A0AAA9SAD2_BOVIN